MKDKIELNMVDNGLDFLLKSLETIDKSDEEFKYSIINLHAGILLILKELLYQEHWSLIFQKIENAERVKIKTGDFISVNFETLIIRLQKIVGIDFNKGLLEKLEWLKKERNQIEHYTLEASADVLKSNIVKLLSYFIPFIKTEMVSPGFIKYDDRRYAEIVDYLNEFDEYIKEKIKFIKEKLRVIKIVLQCPICSQKSVEFVDETKVYCHFCEDNIEDFPEEYISNVIDSYSYAKDGAEVPVHECPECELDTFISLDSNQYVCLTCGITPTQENITVCDGPVCNGILVYRRYEDEAHFCHYCSEHFSSS
jgi:rubrerythrin